MLPAPEPEFVLLGASDAALAHLPVAAYLRLGEMAVLAEYDVEAQTEDTESHEDEGCKEDFEHAVLVYEARTDRLEVVYFVNDVRENIRHGEYGDFLCVLLGVGGERNGVRHYHLLQS